MTTRFYLQATGAAAVSPSFDAGWEQTGQAVRLPMDVKQQTGPLTALTNTTAVTVPITTTQQILGVQFVSNQLFKPQRIDASVTFSMVVRGLENATTNNVFLAYVLRAMSQDGLRVLATLASSMTNAGTEFVATAATRIFSAIVLTASNMLEPFRLVLEIGGHAQAPSAGGSYTYRFGSNAASDFALTSALTTDLNPWAELSFDIGAIRLQNYLAARVLGDGISVTEKLR